MESDSSIEEYDLNDSLLRYLDLSQVSDDHNCSQLLCGDDNDLGHRPETEEDKESSLESKPIIKLRANSTFNLDSQDIIKSANVKLDDFECTPINTNRNLQLSDYYSNSTNYTNYTTSQIGPTLTTPTAMQTGTFRMPNLNPLSNPLQKYIYHQQLLDYNSNNLTPRNQTNNNLMNFGLSRYMNTQFSNTSNPIVAPYVPFINESQSQSKVKFNFQSNLDIAKPKEINKKSSLKPTASQVNYETFSADDIKKCIPFMLKEQSGCRFLQRKVAQIEKYSDEVIMPIAEPSLLLIMVDQFGNYLIQKVLDYHESNPVSFEKIRELVSKFIN